MDVLLYRDKQGREPFSEWLETLDVTMALRIQKRLRRLEQDNPGDAKALGGGIYELRFFFGAGYRIYFGMEGKTLVILLCGGDKSSQAGDIRKAKEYWHAHLQKT